MMPIKSHIRTRAKLSLLIMAIMINVNAQDIDSLPTPVKKYFKLVLADNNSPIKEVHLTHGGYFKPSPRGKWLKIRGKQYFRTDIPEFEWKGKTLLFNATDRFVDGKGRLKVRLLGLIPIVKSEGYETDQAELLRWLGESVWFPTNLLPNSNLHWIPIDSLTARLEYNFKDLKLYYYVSFDKGGRITQIETERYMEKGKLVKWIGKLSDYRLTQGVLVPFHIEAIWKLEDSDFQYVDFFVNDIKFKY